MTSLLERSILMTIGAAALTKDVAEAITGSLVEKGQEAATEGREAVDELVGKAKDEARSVRGKIDDNLKSTFSDLGLAAAERLEELELKVAQLEHRLSLLEGGEARPQAGPESREAGGEGPEEKVREKEGEEEEEEEEPVTEG